MYSEGVIRFVKRRLQRRAAYRYDTPGDRDRHAHLDYVPVLTQYSDDGNAIVGDTADGSAEQHITDIVCGSVIYFLESLNQFVDRGKSWAVHQRGGAPQRHAYCSADGSTVADATEELVLKLLGFYFPTDARLDPPVAAAIETV